MKTDEVDGKRRGFEDAEETCFIYRISSKQPCF